MKEKRQQVPGMRIVSPSRVDRYLPLFLHSGQYSRFHAAATLFFFILCAGTVLADDSMLLHTMPAILASARHQPPAPVPAAVWWRPKPGTSWQWQLSGPIDTSVAVSMYDIDLFDTSAATMDRLHRDGRIVICYFSAGSYEDWRPDRDRYPAAVLGRDLDGWPGERWLDIRRLDLLGPVLQDRLDLAVAKGCDGVEPDNVDGYSNETGFPLTAADQLVFNRWLAGQAHARGLSIGLKNDLGQVGALVDTFDWALNEQCFQYDECDALLPFVRAGKAVFGVEYQGDPSVFCPRARGMDFDWLRKNTSLDSWRISCH